jgi:hypothetical protein
MAGYRGSEVFNFGFSELFSPAYFFRFRAFGSKTVCDLGGIPDLALSRYWDATPYLISERRFTYLEMASKFA